MLRKVLTALLMVAIVMCVGAETTFAEVQEVTATGEYTYGDRETREDAKRLALEDAKRNALEKIFIQVKAYSSMKNFKLVEDDVRSYAEGRMKIIDREYEFVGVSTCRATIKAVIEFDLNDIKQVAEPVDIQNNPVNNKPASTVDISNIAVLEGATEWNGHYYKIFPMPMDWNNAKKFCESVGGHLAVPETRAENDMLKQMFLKYNKSVNECRIGGYREDNGLWRWVTGKMLADYFDWGKEQPRRSTLIFNRELEGKWWTDDAGDRYFFLCEWESASNAHDSTL